MCFVLTCAFLSQDKIAFVWLNEKQCTQSSHSGRHIVYTASPGSSATYSCSRPKTSRRVTKPGSLSEIWFRDLQLLESGSEKICRTVVRESEVNRWLYVVLICSERRLHERSNWLTRQIFKGKLNIREDKLLLYHCLLELGLPKVNVSEQVGIPTSFSSIRSSADLWPPHQKGNL
jgi:hypothetical protein